MSELKLGFIDRIRKKRADKELGIVESSAIYIEKKQNECRGNAAKFRKEADSKAATVIKLYEEGAPMEDIEDLRALVELAEAQYDTEHDNQRLFMNIYIMLEQLIVYVKALIRLGDYKFVTKLIPEKDIPKYVKKSDAGELANVAAIVEQLVDTVQTRLTQSFRGRSEVSEAVAKARAVGASMREEYNKTPGEQRASMADFKAKYAGAAARSADYTVPNFSEAANTQQKPTNKV